MAVPVLADIKDYIGQTSHSDAEIQDALDAEESAQALYCSTSAIAAYPDDLSQALKRRVARNLAMRSVLLGIAGSADAPMRAATMDAEVRRYEKPYQKVTVL